MQTTTTWSARRVTKPSVWYAVMAVTVVLQFLVAVVVANVPQLEPYSWVAWLGGGGAIVTFLVYMGWRSTNAPAARVTLEDRWLVVVEGDREQRLDVTRARIGHARWAYSGMGSMGTIVEIAGEEGTLRLGLPIMVSAERYNLDDSYSFDLQIDSPAAEQVVAALHRATGSFGTPGYRVPQGQPTFAIPLVANRNRDLWITVMLAFGLPLVCGLVLVPLSNALTVGSVITAVVGVLLGVGLVAIFLRRRREARRYQLELTGGEIILRDRLRDEVITRTSPPHLRAQATYYEVSTRGGSWKLPSLRLDLPGFEGELTIAGSGVDPSTWVSRATPGRTAKYAIGAAEWSQLLRAIGWA